MCKYTFDECIQESEKKLLKMVYKGVDLFEILNPGHDQTIFHDRKFSDDFLYECVVQLGYEDHIFGLHDSNWDTIFHNHKYSEWLLKNLLHLSPETNPFDDRNNCNGTIFHIHKYDEWFLKELLEKYEYNIFAIKNGYGENIFFYHKYSKDFILWCICGMYHPMYNSKYKQIIIWLHKKLFKLEYESGRFYSEKLENTEKIVTFLLQKFPHIHGVMRL